MLKNLKRIAYQVSDVEKAKEWYSEFLRQEPAYDSPVAVIFKIGGSSFSLVKGPEPLPEEVGRATTFWEVEDVDATMKRMIDLGATAKSEAKNVLTVRTAQVVDPFGNVIGLSGKILNAKKNVVENQPSDTAHAVALCRALASYDERDEIRRPDSFSELFLRDEIKPSIKEASKRKAIIDRLISRPLYGYLIGRSAFIDMIFSQAIQNKVPQIVFLGAGYDTRALRYRDELGETKVFEVDVPSTQDRKIGILRSSAIALPSHLKFLSVNFKTEDFGKKLEKEGFDKTRKTLFIWEGVMYYLPSEAVENTFRLIKENSPEESGLCFDYLSVKSAKHDSIDSGEPFLSWIEPTKIEASLNHHGFKLLDHLDAVEMGRRYLTLQDGSPAEKPLSKLYLVYAERQRSIVKPAYD